MSAARTELRLWQAEVRSADLDELEERGKNPNGD